MHCAVGPLTPCSAVVRSHIPLASVEASAAAGPNELCVLLPLDSLASFSPMFSEFEERRCVLRCGPSRSCLRLYLLSKVQIRTVPP